MQLQVAIIIITSSFGCGLRASHALSGHLLFFTKKVIEALANEDTDISQEHISEIKHLIKLEATKKRE